MLRSRAFTPAFRFFSGLAVLALVAAFVAGFSSEAQDPIDRVLGPLSLGWKGGVGNHVAYTIFLSLFVASAGLAGLLVAFRDADPEAEAEVVRTDSVPLTRAPAGMNYLPAFAAVGLVVILIGMATASTGLALGGAAFLVIIGFTWTLRTWAERATGDDATNAELYHRIIDPLRVPVVAIITIGVVVIGVSRVLLAVSKTGSVIVFGGLRHRHLRRHDPAGLRAEVGPLRPHGPRGPRRRPGDRRRHHRRRRRRARVREARLRVDRGACRRRVHRVGHGARGGPPLVTTPSCAPVVGDTRVTAQVARRSDHGGHFIRFSNARHHVRASRPNPFTSPMAGAGPALQGE